MKSLAIVRSLRGVSQRQFAARIGVSQTVIYQIENGYRDPAEGFLCRAADVLGMTTGELQHAMEVVSLAQRTCEVRR